MTSHFEVSSVEAFRRDITKILRNLQVNGSKLIVTYHGSPLAIVQPYAETVYARWADLYPGYDTVESWIRAQLDLEHLPEMPITPAETVFRVRVAEWLPPHVQLHGDEFTGPDTTPRARFDLDELRARIEGRESTSTWTTAGETGAPFAPDAIVHHTQTTGTENA